MKKSENSLGSSQVLWGVLWVCGRGGRGGGLKGPL